jgi:hypothetical protein
VTHRIEQVLVMDTDDMPGRGGYGVVGISPGVTQAERLFVSENFGISDYLHDRENDRLYLSVFNVPGGRRALVRRFANGTRRNGTQSRVFVHTMFLEDDTFDALHGLPWLLADASFRLPGQQQLQPLTRDRGPLLSDPNFRPLEWEPTAETQQPPVTRFSNRLRQVERWLQDAGLRTTPIDAVAAVIAAFQSGQPAVLSQGVLFEQLTLLAWSMLPLRDRDERAWTQHDSQNTVIAFAIANATADVTVDVTAGATAVARWIVEMNTTSVESWREFHDKTTRCKLSARGPALAAWKKWRDALLAVVEKVNAVDTQIDNKLAALAKAADPKVHEPWVDGVEVLQILWSNVRRAVAAGEDVRLVVERWASRLTRSGLDRVIFRVPPPAEWLDATSREIGADPLVDFFIRATPDESAAVPTRAAVGRWLLDGPRKRGEKVSSESLARLAVSLMGDESGLIEPLLDWLLEDPNGLAVLQKARQLPGYGNLVLLATLRALRRQHPQTTSYVRDVLLPQLERSQETRSRVNDVIADAVATMLRDEPESFIRFASGLGDRTILRLTTFVTAWLMNERDRTLPLAREIVRRASEQQYPIEPTVTLAVALARSGEPATIWFRVLLRTARTLDEGLEPAAMNRFLTEIDQLAVIPSVARNPGGRGAQTMPSSPPTQVPRSTLGMTAETIDALVGHLNHGIASQERVGRCVRALIVLTSPAWTIALSNAIAGVLAYTSRTAEWDAIVAALAEKFESEAGAVLRRFWDRIDPSEVANVSTAMIDATSFIDGTHRAQLLQLWTPRLRRLPAGDRAERFINVLAEVAGGVPAAMRVPLAWRELTLGTATEATLNQLDLDLFARDGDRSEEEMIEALRLWSGGGTSFERARALLQLLASDHVLPTVKFTCEGMIAAVLEELSADDWNEVVRLPREQLFARGMSAMLLARQLGGQQAAAEAAQVFESACRRSRRFDVADGLALGRRDRTPWRRLQRALGFGSKGR